MKANSDGDFSVGYNFPMTCSFLTDCNAGYEYLGGSTHGDCTECAINKFAALGDQTCQDCNENEHTNGKKAAAKCGENFILRTYNSSL